jgi:hypothetical protein
MYILAGVTPGWDKSGAYCNNVPLKFCIWIDTDNNMAACESISTFTPIEEYELEFDEYCKRADYKSVVFIYHGDMSIQKKGLNEITNN